MSKADKLRARFWATTKPTDFSWEELVRLMKAYGYEQRQGSGSRVKFFNPNQKSQIHLHKRHPDSTLLGYQLDDVKNGLNNAGIYK